jgi:hypothetical protein
VAIMETRDGAGRCGATRECGLVMDVSRDVGVRGERKGGRVVSVRRAVSGRVRSGRREEKGRSGRASGRLG